MSRLVAHAKAPSLAGILAFVAACACAACSSSSTQSGASAVPSSAPDAASSADGGAAPYGSSDAASAGDAPASADAQASALYRAPCTGSTTTTVSGLAPTTGTWTFTYDGDRVSTIVFRTSPHGARRIDLGYTSDGLLSTEQISDSTTLVHYSFVVGSGLIQRVLQEGTLDEQFTYGASNRIASVAQAGALVLDFQWSADGTSADARYAGSSQSNHYELSADGRLLTVTADASPTDQSRSTYSYDARGHLTRIEDDENGATVGDQQFTYDAAGDIVRIQTTSTAAGNTTGSDSTFDYSCWSGRQAPAVDGCAPGGDPSQAARPCWYRIIGQMGFADNAPY